MRVSSVCLAESRPALKKNLSVKLNNPATTLQPDDTFEKTVGSNVNFGKWGGAIGTIVGTAVGVGVTALTGGATAFLLPLFAGGGGEIGDGIDAKYGDNHEELTVDDSYTGAAYYY